MTRVVLASGNPGKLREFSELLADVGLQVVPQSQLGIDAAAETGLTFIENALLKARHAARSSGQPALADDSGISVDALDGAPGIYSARYAGAGADDQTNLNKVVAAIRDVPEDQRTAHYYCVIVYLQHAADPTPLVVTGRWHGRLLSEPRGGNGFGYDPIFYVTGEGCTAAELEPARKNQLSHRGQALRALLDQLREGHG